MKAHPRAIIQELVEMPLTLENFLANHPEISRDHLASITGKTRRTIDEWFRETPKQSPDRGDLALLWMYHCRSTMPIRFDN
jgi:hypothetical protein